MYGAMMTTVWRFPGQEKPSSTYLYAGAFVTTNDPALLLRCSGSDPVSDAALAAPNEKPPDTGSCVRGFARQLLPCRCGQHVCDFCFVCGT